MKTPAAIEITTSARDKRNSKFTSRQKRLLSELIRRGAASPYELFKIVGTTGVAQIVASLRKKGINIVTEWFCMKDRDGKAVRFGRYSIGDDAAERLAELGWKG